ELRGAFLAQTPEALLLNQCIFSYWRSSSKGRAHSMALLATLDSSIFSLASQYALVALQAIRLFPSWFKDHSALAWHKGIFKLLCKSLSFQQAAVGLWFKEFRADRLTQ
ncbi:MAG: hypothetical protein PHE55_20390, partial [Methylococcaceae bacterium]|nr:hypothetical protein [Methylococcaceae bacterium]